MTVWTASVIDRATALHRQLDGVLFDGLVVVGSRRRINVSHRHRRLRVIARTAAFTFDVTSFISSTAGRGVGYREGIVVDPSELHR